MSRYVYHHRSFVKKSFALIMKERFAASYLFSTLNFGSGLVIYFANKKVTGYFLYCLLHIKIRKKRDVCGQNESALRAFPNAPVF